MQLQRLNAVLSVTSIGRSDFLQDAALRTPKELSEKVTTALLLLIVGLH